MEPGSEHLALFKHLAHYTLSTQQAVFLHHCLMQVSELSGTSPLLQHRHQVLLHLPQSSKATQGHVTALAVLNSQVASAIHMETLEMGVIYWGVQIWSKR